MRSRYSLATLGWQAKPYTGDDKWDGGIALFLVIMKKHREPLKNSDRGKYLLKWEKLAKDALDRDEASRAKGSD